MKTFFERNPAAVAGLLVLLLAVYTVPCIQADELKDFSQSRVGALGHIEPLHGIYELQAPSGIFPARLSKLLVEEGEKVTQGQVVAIIDNMQTLPADVERSRAEAVARQAAYEQAQRDYLRFKALAAQGAVSQEAFDQADRKFKETAAQLKASRAEIQSQANQLGHIDIIAPVSGTVLKIYARDGESVPWNKGVLAMGITDHMMAVAEVYEDDIRKVQPGQRAIITSKALAGELMGTVERIGVMVDRPSDFSANPAENTEARVIKVHIRLDDPRKVEALTGLLVHTVILTGKQAE
ncbi:efflux RND transporter periplasmic adaptor subunit [Maridesulfovibrio sp. FT414]|uniref:efflux RND transporter periplasmic adaptor subunit n=1 Tax=Maridesulfovibrio sp. FT414 TaxID=2979469 RepID=UPI003D809E7C